jgi:Domain of unknown function (DUF4190)
MTTAPPGWGPPPTTTDWSAPPLPRTEPLAVAALVCGIATVVGAPALAVVTVALIGVVGGRLPGSWDIALLVVVSALVTVALGHVARGRCRRNATGGSGLATAGLVLGYSMAALTLLVLLSAVGLRASVTRTTDSFAESAVPGGTFTVPAQPAVDGTARGVLLGQVTDDTGAPVRDVAVTIGRADPSDTTDTPACPTSVTTRTGDDGRYFVPLCQLGRGLAWTASVNRGDTTVTSDLVYVDEGQSATADLVLPRLR